MRFIGQGGCKGGRQAGRDRRLSLVQAGKEVLYLVCSFGTCSRGFWDKQMPSTDAVRPGIETCV